MGLVCDWVSPVLNLGQETQAERVAHDISSGDGVDRERPRHEERS